MTKPWQISTTECAGDKEATMRRGNVYQLANGYMGYRGTLDESGPDEAVGITLAGLFDQVGAAWREPVNAPNGGYTTVTLEGTELTTRGTHVSAHRQTLHFANALFERETTFAVGGRELTIRSERFLSAAVPNLGVIRYTLRCTREAGVTLRTGIDYRIWDLNGPHLPDLQARQESRALVVEGLTHEQKQPVAVAEAVDWNFGAEAHEVREQRNLRAVSFRAEPGRTYTFHKYFAVFTGHDRAAGAPAAAAIAAVQAARTAGYTACRAAHDAEWKRKWSRGDVIIVGDPVAQQALRYSLLQLLMVAPVAGSANSIPARALSGQVYKGAIFWDTEMFMFPYFVHTDPAKAVELLRYRINTLDGARRKAKTEGTGYRGAFYAWESQETGDDACTYFNIGDPITGKDIRTYFRDKQIHISGDVALAMWQYFELTGDDTLLLEGGAEVILECARFFTSYGAFSPKQRRFGLRDVTGPDEYHERVDNNAFTNAIARETFVIANATVDHLKRRHPQVLRALLRKIGIAKELAGFRAAATKLYVPAPDKKTGVIEQFDGYLQRRYVPVKELKAQMVHPHEYLGGEKGLAVPTQVIKQADVVAMLNLFRDRHSTAVKQANWEFYEPRTEHGSSLSACAYAMVATEFGKLDFAYEYFLKTAKIDLEAKYKIYVGTIFIGGSHPAANGGAWMTAVLGFGGVHAGAKRLAIEPRLPKRWKRLEFNITWRGLAFRISITPKAVTVTAHADNRRAAAVVVAGRTVQCRPGKPVKVAIPASRSAAKRQKFSA